MFEGNVRVAEEPLKKITLNVNLADYEFLKTRYGYGYSEMIRQFLKDKCKQLRETDGE